MRLVTDILVGLIAALHLWFMILEMFLWKKPLGRKTFGTTPEFADDSAVLAANQGLYNGFLVAGLAWGLSSRDPAQAFALQTFFLGCVAIAGIFGGVTVNRRIFLIQGLPALIALGLLRFCGAVNT